MTIKMGANKMDQVKIRRMAKAGVAVEAIAKELKIDVSVIKAYVEPAEEVEAEEAGLSDFE